MKSSFRQAQKALHFQNKCKIMKTIGIIPARFASLRFPGKPLADLEGKPVIQRVYEQALKARQLSEVVVATDDQRIYDTVRAFGGAVVLTGEAPSGTDRCAAALAVLDRPCDFVLNIQGDEPFIAPAVIDQLIDLLKSTEQVDIATLVRPLEDSEAVFNPNVVKAVFDRSNWALYFSRHPIPYVRNAEKEQWLQQARYFQHIGLYGFRRRVLEQVAQLQPSSLEQAESLEQLRWLENGLRIKVGLTQEAAFGIDTPEDLEQARRFLAKPLKSSD